MHSFGFYSNYKRTQFVIYGSFEAVYNASPCRRSNFSKKRNPGAQSTDKDWIWFCAGKSCGSSKEDLFHQFG